MCTAECLLAVADNFKMESLVKARSYHCDNKFFPLIDSFGVIVPLILTIIFLFPIAL